MDNAVYTFEQLLNQSLEAQGDSDMCKLTQRCQDRVLKVKHEHMERSKEETVKYTYIYIYFKMILILLTVFRLDIPGKTCLC